ncbi:sciellin isoform X2 [Dunckerocampus dactyliophorus]|uniref:sciellin isoform X2 n=1 Tax=Dunckerocampus dactyliophorus TaxID=161453 RepID=UPI0024065FC6|nr:sciellin isoform X2 [Dunckerocampus dactyliophorus]
MSFQLSKSSRTTTSSSSSLKSPSLMKDDSWIRRDEDEFEPVDRDPNFGKSVLSHYKSSETISSVGAETQITKSKSTSVQALTKRFSGSQDELTNSPYSKTRASYTISSPPAYNDPATSTTTTTVSKDGKTTETTVTTSHRKTPTKTETFTERVQSSSKGTLYSNFSPSRTTKVTETYVSSQKDANDLITSTLSAEDKLYDTLIPSAIKDDIGDSRTSLTSTETVTVKRSINGAEDDLYDTLLPKSITSSQSSPYSSSVTKREIVTLESNRGGDSPTPLSSSSSLRSTSRTYTEDSPTTRITSYTVSSSSLPSDDYNKSYYYSSSKPSYEYSSITNPTEYSSTVYRSSSEILSPAISSKSSIKSVYTSPERTVLDRELCTSCHKPFNGDAKMVLDDMKINCHAFCFKCEVCNGTLGHLKAGDCMWVYNRMVHCESCFDVTREKWRH